MSCIYSGRPDIVFDSFVNGNFDNWDRLGMEGIAILTIPTWFYWDREESGISTPPTLEVDQDFGTYGSYPKASIDFID